MVHRRGLILSVVGVLLVGLVLGLVALFNWRTGRRPNLGQGPLAGAYLTRPTAEEQSQTCPGVGGGQPVVRLTAPPIVDTLTICIPDPQDPEANAFDGPLVPRTISRGDSAEVARALDRWAAAWAGPDELPWRFQSVACTEEFRLNPSFAITAAGVTVRPVGPYTACRRPTAEADVAFAAVLALVR
ncbi:hypothetical protein JOE57_000956 [Microlunatus panaciterrae]|uniref:PknH-like extracellular domain-containing protein n=1 Tax=Microlunatus panaciterrae TaxID=400768 RepID=A0ABS2RG99_9ACTN|nr:hypothetical protein [Microlunatus panaciterrae]MBM7798035.1 hypothetical protein [Microlunatus panaciterrae]